MLNKTIVVIPARGGSKRIPNKNLRLLAGNPLIVYSIKLGLELGVPVYVTSDSELILKLASDWGASPVVRPAELAKDDSTDLDWMGHFLEYYRGKEGAYPEQIVFLRPTTPLRTLETVKRGLSTFIEASSSLRSVQPLAEAPEKAFREEAGYLVPAVGCMSCPGGGMSEVSNLPNQAFPLAYTGNGYIDIIRPDVIIKSNTLYGYNVQAFITEKTIDIDDLNDFKYAEYLLSMQHSE